MTLPAEPGQRCAVGSHRCPPKVTPPHFILEMRANCCIKSGGRQNPQSARVDRPAMSVMVPVRDTGDRGGDARGAGYPFGAQPPLPHAGPRLRRWRASSRSGGLTSLGALVASRTRYGTRPSSIRRCWPTSSRPSLVLAASFSCEPGGSVPPFNSSRAARSKACRRSRWGW
jgi:hypothetical protein